MVNSPQDFPPFTEKDMSGNWNHSRFIGEVIKAAQKHDIPESALPQQINLEGRLGEMSDSLLQQTLVDPSKRERGRTGVVNLEGKLRLGETVVGE